MIESLTAGWRGDAEEREASAQRTRLLAPIICLAYAFGFSMIAFDQVMSLTPTWFSNLFGAFFSWGCFLSAVSVTALLTVLHRNYPGLEGEIGKDRLHDLGKMIFAFSIFWMYLFFSQYLVIWYGNLPEETQFFLGAPGQRVPEGHLVLGGLVAARLGRAVGEGHAVRVDLHLGDPVLVPARPAPEEDGLVPGDDRVGVGVRLLGRAQRADLAVARAARTPGPSWAWCRSARRSASSAPSRSPSWCSRASSRRWRCRAAERPLDWGDARPRRGGVRALGRKQGRPARERLPAPGGWGAALHALLRADPRDARRARAAHRRRARELAHPARRLRAAGRRADAGARAACAHGGPAGRRRPRASASKPSTAALPRADASGSGSGWPESARPSTCWVASCLCCRWRASTGASSASPPSPGGS